MATKSRHPGLCGPAPGTVKVLMLKYKFNGNPVGKPIAENGFFSFCK